MTIQELILKHKHELSPSLSKDLKIHVNIQEQFNAKEAFHRSSIRQAIANELEKTFDLARLPEILILEGPPKLDTGYVSISHCLSLGGFVYSMMPVGFDLEERLRVAPELVKRVSQESELKLTPHASLLWSIKEATFKSLYGFNQPPVATHITLTQMISLKEETPGAQIYSFLCNWTESNEPISGLGICGIYENHQFAVFVLDPK